MKVQPIFLCLALLLTGCSAQQTQTSTSPALSSSQASAQEAVTASSQLFSDRDWDDSYDTNAPTITFDGDTITTSDPAVTVEGSTATITQEGTYILSGSLSDGTLLIDAPDTAKIQLVLDGVELHSQSYAPLYIREADKVFLTLAPNSQNTLSNSGNYAQLDDHNVDAPLFCRSDLTLNGTGSLTVDSPGGHGIVCKDELTITGGTYAITASSHGLSANDGVCIAAGTFTINAGKDGIQSQHDEDPTLGYVYLEGGSYTFTCDGDGISASAWLTAVDGTYSLTCGGGYTNGRDHTDTTMGGPGFPGSTTTDTTEDTPSCKGLKAGSTLTLQGGSYTIDSADDALHTNGDMTVEGGTYHLSTGDDALHADSALTVVEGDISIPQCYEGLEGYTLTVSGGRIALVSSDDGLNAAGDAVDTQTLPTMTISGGILYVQATGDGLDSNGDLTVTGGEVYVICDSTAGDSTLDYDGSASITGGIVIAAGPSQMAQTFGSTSTQGSALLSAGNQQADTTVTLTDATGTALVSWDIPAAYNCVVVSCPQMTVGNSYTLTAGTSSQTFALEKISYSSVATMGQPGGMMGNGQTGFGNPGRQPGGMAP